MPQHLGGRKAPDKDRLGTKQRHNSPSRKVRKSTMIEANQSKFSKTHVRQVRSS